MCAVNFNNMDLETFENLKEGDRVICNYGSSATVIKTGVIDSLKKSKMVKLKVDKKKWSCPYFFRNELNCIE